MDEEDTNAPYIGDVDSLNALVQAYKHNPKFSNKLNSLTGEKKFKHYRKVKRDGSCFYRAYMFGVLEYINNDADAATRLEKVIEESYKKLIDQGFSEIAVEDFWETTLEAIRHVKTEALTTEQLIAYYNQDDVNMSIMIYARFLTSYNLQTNVVEFEPFMPEGKTVLQFIREEVEPPTKDCDHVQIVALTNEIGVGAEVLYLDQSEGPIVGHAFAHTNTHIHTNTSTSAEAQPERGEGGGVKMFLLYRPGHYDLLYS